MWRAVDARREGQQQQQHRIIIDENIPLAEMCTEKRALQCLLVLTIALAYIAAGVLDQGPRTSNAKSTFMTHSENEIIELIILRATASERFESQ